MFYPQIMNIRSSDLVLEVGPGTCPYWRSDVLVDRFMDDEAVDHSQFGGGPQLTDGKPLVLIDGPYLPFADRQFDYLICSQVLEHVPDEDLPILLREFSRVAPRIYIEVPRPAYDIVYDFDVHLNFIDIVNNQVIYIPKSATTIGQIKNMTAYCRAMRESSNFAVENAGLSAIAVGQEFVGAVPILRAVDEQNFFRMSADSRFAAAEASWRWRSHNLFARKFNRFTKTVRMKRYRKSESAQ